jgi:hypothetical protein
MRFATKDGEAPLGDAFDAEPAAVRTITVVGTGPRQRELVLPYRGSELRGADLDRQLDRWVERGVIEASCADAVRTVAANPDWLQVAGRRVVVLGAGAEMGPLHPLLRWGADLVAVDLPRPEIWQPILGTVQQWAGTLLLPEAGADGVGADLLADLVSIGAWLDGIDGRLVLGNYVYADGATSLRLAAAADALTVFLADRRPDLELSFLATPTDVFAVPADAAAESARRYGAARLRRPVQLLSAGRLLRRNYPPDANPPINDSLVPQQGPNYALAKRVHRWRASTARAAGRTVSMNIAPATRTRSVVRNRLLAAAYAGAHRFGIEIFEPATSNTLMAALLVHDLHVAPAAGEHPWHDEAFAAAHGGLWRQPYAPRSALGLAAIMGLPRLRG